MSDFDAEGATADNIKAEYLADLWDEFVRDKDPAILAKYISRGGDLTEQVKASIIHVLEDRTKAKQQRGQNKRRDLAVYLAVSNLMSINRIAAKLHEKFPNKIAPPKFITLGQAMNWYAFKHNVELPTVRAQYKRGEQLPKKIPTTE